MCTCPNYMAWSGRYHPLTGKPKLDFIPHGNFDKLLKANIPFIEVPCGKCLECNITYGKQWADRCYLESKNSPYNYFVTLTYDDDQLPVNGSLVRKHLQDFMKRLRKRVGAGVRFFGCGEYGEKSLRPHYHIMLFNCHLPDLSFVAERLEEDGRYHKHNITGTGNMYSRIIYDSWQHKGLITVSEFHYIRAAYIAQYCTKKIVKKAELNKLGLLPEFIAMSTRPGIGAYQYEDDMILDDYMVVCDGKKGKATQPARYFQKLFIKKYGDDIFNDLVLKDRLEKRKRSRDNYEHSEKIKERGNTIRNYHLVKNKKLRDGV